MLWNYLYIATIQIMLATSFYTPSLWLYIKCSIWYTRHICWVSHIEWWAPQLITSFCSHSPWLYVKCSISCIRHICRVQNIIFRQIKQGNESLAFYVHLYIYIWSLYKEKLVNLCFPSPFLVWAFIKFMATIILFPLSFALFAPFSSSTFQTLSKGSSLSSEKPEDVLTSPNVVFSAGFYSFGENAFCFAIEKIQPKLYKLYQWSSHCNEKEATNSERKGREQFGNERRRKFWWKRNDFLNCSLQWRTVYIYIYIHKDQLWPYQRSLNLRDWFVKCGESLGA